MKRVKISMMVSLAILFGSLSAFMTTGSSDAQSSVVYANAGHQNPMPEPSDPNNGLEDVTGDYNSDPEGWRTLHCPGPTTPTCVATWDPIGETYSDIFPGTYAP